MEKATLKFLDAQTTTGIRMTSFGATVEDTIKDFILWVRDNKVHAEELLYAELFERIDGKLTLVSQLSLNESGECLINNPGEPMSPLSQSKVSLFNRLRRN